jgi:hypothetical protein
MDFQKAIKLKTEMSQDFLSVKKKPVKLMFAVTSAPLVTSTASQEMREQVNGIGVGKKDNGESFIKILTKAKSFITPVKLSSYFGVDPMDIRIQEVGVIRPKMVTTRLRPPYPGISVGHYKITAGTLGCYVKDAKNKIFVLSNNHVLANTNKGHYGDAILQPGKLDSGKTIKDRIAQLSYLMEIDFTNANLMDAAIAEIDAELNPNYLINNSVQISGTTEPRYKMKVEKFGRTTGHTKGKVSTRNLDLKVDFDGIEVEFQDQFEIKGNNGTMFCDGGDSGSLIFESASSRAVGLLFAGADDGTTFATPINNVLNEFSVRIL